MNWRDTTMSNNEVDNETMLNMIAPLQTAIQELGKEVQELKMQIKKINGDLIFKR